ncbi:hypothetical protein [Arthrobacter sp. HMSC06H05]|nr:hypothetical protein [Arthrobacter sp. HMSC06H05]
MKFIFHVSDASRFLKVPHKHRAIESSEIEFAPNLLSGIPETIERDR